MTQQPDPQPGFYYVSVRRERGPTHFMGAGTDHRLLLGPFVNDHARALASVEQVRRKAEDLDPRACWYAFGTCRVESAEPPEPGILNHLLPEIAPCAKPL